MFQSILDELNAKDEWRQTKAACLGMGFDIFYSEESTKLAKSICYHCPAKLECFERAVEDSEIGVWGGTTTNERVLISRGKLTYEDTQKDVTSDLYLLSPKKVASMFDISITFLIKATRRGYGPQHLCLQNRLRRYRPEDVQAWILGTRPKTWGSNHQPYIHNLEDLRQYWSVRSLKKELPFYDGLASMEMPMSRTTIYELEKMRVVKQTHSYVAAQKELKRTYNLPIAKCGTKSGANRHRNLGEIVCDDCKAAESSKKRTA